MKWILPEQSHSDILEWLLTSRGIKDKDIFFNPTVNQIHSPLLLNDIKEAVETIDKAIKDKKKIFIHGDFDVDGITATSIMWDFLYRKLKANVTPYIPSRFDEGYGLSEDSINNIIDEGGELIITVDCGVKDIDLVAKYADKIDFIITDHHTIIPSEQSLEFDDGKIIGDYLVSKSAKAVVHQKLGNYPFHDICGACISWKVCCGINETLNLGIDMTQYLDLVALGTVCDVMPLIDENRAIVKLGIEQLRKTTNKGLISLMQLSAVNIEKADTYHIGYLIGPRLNAAGRISSAIDAVRLLSTTSETNAHVLAAKLDRLNQERQELTKQYLEIAEEQIKSQLNNKILFAYGDNWPEGIVGLIAGKLQQKYGRPVLVASKNHEIIKGSARSGDIVNISTLLKEASEYLVRFGGHAGAAGFTVKQENLENLQNFIREYADKNITDDDLIPKLLIDALLSPEAMSMRLAEDLAKLAPFGTRNEKPLLAMSNLQISDLRPIGKTNEHAKLLLTNNGKLHFEALGFGKYSTLLTQKQKGANIDIAGNIDIDEWNGNRKLVFKISQTKGSE